MREDIKDLEQAVSENYVSPEAYDQQVKILDKLKENYERITYIMVLLDRPNNKKKENRYKDARLKNLPKSATLEAVEKENEQVLSDFKKSVSDLYK